MRFVLKGYFSICRFLLIAVPQVLCRAASKIFFEDMVLLRFESRESVVQISNVIIFASPLVRFCANYSKAFSEYDSVLFTRE